jgi:O-antigen ligase
MKFQEIITIFKERMAGVNVLTVFLIGLVVSLVIAFVLIRWGPGCLMALAYIFTSLVLISSSALAGIALMVRFPLVVLLSLYAFFSRKNRIYFSKAAGVLALLPLIMLVNTPRAMYPMDALGLSILFFLFFVGIILGGQRIFGDAQGRATFTKIIAIFTIIMTCIQIPFYTLATGRLAGVFQTTVGFMLVGMIGTIILTWFALRQKVWSVPFIFFTFFAVLTYIMLILTGGRSSLACTALGVVVLLVRKFKRNIVITLAVFIILGPIASEAILSFPGFENVKAKLFSLKDTRTPVWREAWHHIEERPLIGFGTGTSFIMSAVELGMTYHNAHLHFAVDHGIPVAVVIMLLLLWFPFRGLVLMRRCQTEELKDAAILSAAILSSYALGSFVASSISTTTGALPAFAAIALQEGVRAESREIELYGWEGEGEEALWLDGSEEMLTSDFDIGTEQAQIYE